MRVDGVEGPAKDAIARLMVSDDRLMVFVSGGPASLVASPLHALSEDEWDARAEAPARAALAWLQDVHRTLADGGGLAVVVVPHVSLEGAAGLVATTTGIEAVRLLAKSAARRWAPIGIRVNIVAALPSLFGATADDVGGDAIRTASPMPVDPSALADAIVLLSRPEARHLTGATITLDGGALMLP